MAGLEVIVRPVVFPDIRPKPARVLPPVDDPTKGFCTIHGNPANQVGLSSSYSISISQSRGTETERRVDTARVYQMDDDGTVNKDNFVDIEVANRIKMREGKKPAVDGRANEPGAPFITPRLGSPEIEEVRVDHYQKVEEADNIEIRNTDEIKTSSDAQ